MSLLETTVERWANVREENARDRNLVTQRDWDNWKAVDNDVTATLKGVIERSARGVSAADKAALRSINDKIDSATHRTGKSLKQYAREQGVIKVEDPTVTTPSTRQRLMGLLTGSAEKNSAKV